MTLSRRTRALTALALTGTLALAACGSDDDEPAASGDPATTEAEAPETTEAEILEVTGIDYAFEGIPSTVAAGTELTFVNGSEEEAHELILMRINDDETRGVQELLQLPEEEAMKSVTMKGVAVAATPGSEGEVVDGELVVDEPGRYVALCFIPVGADPVAMQEAQDSGEPPAEDPDAGPPHFTRGMVQEFTVE